MAHSEEDSQTSADALSGLPEDLRHIAFFASRPQPDGQQCVEIVRSWLDDEFRDFRAFRETKHLELFEEPRGAGSVTDRDYAFWRLAPYLQSEPELTGPLREGIEYCLRIDAALVESRYSPDPEQAPGPGPVYNPELLDPVLGPRAYPKWTLIFEDGESVEAQSSVSSQVHLDLMHLICVARETFPAVLEKALSRLAGLS